MLVFRFQLWSVMFSYTGHQVVRERMRQLRPGQTRWVLIPPLPDWRTLIFWVRLSRCSLGPTDDVQLSTPVEFSSRIPSISPLAFSSIMFPSLCQSSSAHPGTQRANDSIQPDVAVRIRPISGSHDEFPRCGRQGQHPCGNPAACRDERGHSRLGHRARCSGLRESQLRGSFLVGASSWTNLA